MNNAIKHPSHYAEGRKYEPKDVIRDWGLNFNLGNAVKYISRAGRKDDIVQELKKAQEYLQFEIDAIEAERGTKSKVECTHSDEAISLGAIMNMGVEVFFHTMRAVCGKIPPRITVEGEEFILTSIKVGNSYPVTMLCCKNDDFEIEIRSRH